MTGTLEDRSVARRCEGGKPLLIFRGAPVLLTGGAGFVGPHHYVWLRQEGLSQTIRYFDALVRDGGVDRPLAHGTAAE